MASKKNLAVLLIMPFAISLLSFTAINMTFNLIDNDILSIDWDYNDSEAFALTNEEYRHHLVARAINDRNYPTNQQLVWNVYNADEVEEPRAEILLRGRESYLHTLNTGDIVITVSNEKGNVQKKMNATIYNNNVIIFNNAEKGSQNNIDSKLYYGQYDLVNGKKISSSINFDLTYHSEYNDSDVKVLESSTNIDVNLDKKVINFRGSGDAYVKFAFVEDKYPETCTYNFNIVKDGINVYSYDDLMYCTNKSQNGEVVVLRKNLESLANTYVLDANGNPTSTLKNNETALFGHRSNNKWNFKNEIYKFETRYNQEYIRQWNSFVDSHPSYKKINNQVNVGIHVQKDFYGNGFTINLHNLTYPYDVITAVDQDGNTQNVPYLSNDNLFRGPLPYYTLGDPNNMPLVTAYGQDNIGMYVEGNNITINDLDIKNCDFGNNLANLDYVGTVMEIYGDNITVKNSRLANGKTVFRAYDSKNALLDNCMLSYSRNFLVSTGSYKYNKVDANRAHQFTLEDGKKQTIMINDYLAPKAAGDIALNNYLMGDNKGNMFDAMHSIQTGLDLNRSTTFRGDLTINDTLFYRSGITSIALETLFNGPFLYDAIPSMVGDLFSKVDETMGNKGAMIPLLPKEVGGISSPVELKLSGDTKFYDYKTSDILDVNGLVGENISTVVADFAPEMADKVSLDKIFPIKDILLEDGSKMGALINRNGKINVNAPIAFYGGGLNNSRVIYDDTFAYQEHMLDTTDVDLLRKYSELPKAEGGIMENAANIVVKCVTIVSGFNPFKFTLSKGDGYLYGEAPKVQDLINNAK